MKMRAFRHVANGTSAAILMLSGLMSLGFTGVAHAAPQPLLAPKGSHQVSAS